MIVPRDIKAVKNSFETQIILYYYMGLCSQLRIIPMPEWIEWTFNSKNDCLFSTLLKCDIFHIQWAVSS